MIAGRVSRRWQWLVSLGWLYEGGRRKVQSRLAWAQTVGMVWGRWTVESREQTFSGNSCSLLFRESWKDCKSD
jgi:hypothetical protein